MYVPEIDFVEDEHSLQALLHSLLDMESKSLVSDFRIAKQLREDQLILLGLADERQRGVADLRTRQ